LNFLSETSYAVNASQVSLADVNGDGSLDLIVAASGYLTGNATFSVMLGNGGASFQPPIQHAIPNTSAGAYQFVSLSAGDVNGDGKPDIVVGIASVGISAAGSLLFFAGNGDGTFQNGTAISSALAPLSIALADLNGDGKLDLVVLDEDQYAYPFVSVALGAGNGSFGAPATYPASGSSGLAVGDVNGDGVPDIVTSGVSILFGNGKGAFPTRADYLSQAATGIVLTDLDGDGRIDIVAGVYGNPLIFTGSNNPASNSSVAPMVSVFFGRGSGMFWGAPTSIVPGLAASEIGLSVATADFTGDGIPDLAYSDLTGQITILQGLGNGFFDPVFQYQLAGGLSGLPAAIAIADFNGDGKPDLAVAVQNPGNAPNLVLVFLGKGDGTLEAPVPITLGSGLSVSSLAVGDFNGDGKPDLAVVVNTENNGAADGVLVYLGNGEGSFKPSTSYAVGPYAVAAAAGDFNGDGKLDLAITSEGTYSQQNGSISLLLGKGDGTFSATAPIPLSGGPSLGPYSIVAADFNGDGKLDLAVTLSNYTTAPGGLAVLLGRGDGSFQSPVIYPVTSAGFVAGDLNGDGIPDLIVDPPTSEDAYGGAGYLIGNGDGTFGLEVQLAAQIGPLVTADFNRDGKLDLAGADQLFGVVSFLNASQPQPPFTVVSAASLAPGPIAPNSLASAFGRNLASIIASAGPDLLPVTLSGTSVSVKDSTGATLPAPLLYVSPSQVNFLVAAGAAAGPATVTIASQSGASAVTLSSAIEVAPVAPAMFTLNGSGLAAAYAVLVSSDGTQTVEQVYSAQTGAVAAVPVNLGSTTDQVYLALYGTGIRNAASGSVTVNIQGLNAPVTYAGPQPGFPGLDQVNVLVPRALAGSGSVSIVLTANQIVANTVYLSIQ
jgi:uncharacterized protein (TIGR03437 family)